MTDMTKLIDKVRQKQPLVHNITNQVVVNFTANGLYAIGAAPVMANAIEEAADMASNADALLLNIGTLTHGQVDAMVEAGKAANKKGIPVVLDPVGVGATPFRNQAVQVILEKVDITAIRGNAGEVAQLAGIDAETRGVDATFKGDNKQIAIQAAKELKIPIVLTGEQDVITDGVNGYVVTNGHPLLTKVTGTGCLLSSVVAAFLATGEQVLKAATGAVSFYGVAAERAAVTTEAPGSFQVGFLDALYQVTSSEVDEYAMINPIIDEKEV